MSRFSRTIFNRFSPDVLAAIVALFGALLATYIYTTEENAAQDRFIMVADEAAARVEMRLEEHITLLSGTRALFLSNPEAVTREQFRDFTGMLGLESDYRGIQGIGFAAYVPKREQEAAIPFLKAAYGITRKPWPSTQEKRRALILLLEPDDKRNRAALGYDMFSEKTRREAMIEAIKTGGWRASGPVELKQEITSEKQKGFLIYAPIYRSVRRAIGSDKEVYGFVYAPFRIGDLFNAVLDDERFDSLSIEVRDSEYRNEVIFSQGDYSADVDGGALHGMASLPVAGRTWELYVAAPNGHPGIRRNGLAYAIVAFAMALAFALLLRRYAMIQSNATERAEQVAQMRQAQIEEKELHAHEMAHRIKNSIARISGMARLTSRNAESLEAFTTEFEARLEAMANAQNLITQSRVGGAELRDLIGQELFQVFGEQSDQHVQGDTVRLGPKAVQSLGLAIHEMATNMLKYAGESAMLSVNWTINESENAVELEWHEPANKSAAPRGKTGFGTVLINSCIERELGGSLDRSYGEDGMRISMSLPLDRLDR